jgi:hypothetical protein
MLGSRCALYVPKIWPFWIEHCFLARISTRDDCTLVIISRQRVNHHLNSNSRLLRATTYVEDGLQKIMVDNLLAAHWNISI